jgi:hypothetical protein
MEDTSLDSILVKYGLNIGFALSGFFGALLLALKSKGQKISTSIATVLAGTACANYLTPLVITILPEVIRTDAKYGVAFMMGFAGLKGLEVIINIITDYLKNRKLNINIKMK